jgi:hypothetical protein
MWAHVFFPFRERKNMWAPARWMVGLGALLLASAFVVDEATRLLECAAQCGERHYRNARLLESPMCTEWAQRRHMEDLCGRAERENAVPFVGCAARAYWSGSAVYAALGNHLMVVALVAPALLFLIHQWFADRRAQRRSSEREKEEGARPQVVYVGHAPLLTPQGRASLRMYPEEEEAPPGGHRRRLLGMHPQGPVPQGRAPQGWHPHGYPQGFAHADDEALVQPDL